MGQKAQIEENSPKPRREKQARLGEKLKNRIFAPTGRRKKQAELGQKAEKQNICSNGKKREASRIGAKESKRGTLLQRAEETSKLDWSKKLKKRIFTPTKRKEEKNR